jgi:hypothetical protein
MADTKVSALTAIDALVAADLIPVVDDPAGTPVSKKATMAQVVTLMEARMRQVVQIMVLDDDTTLNVGDGAGSVFFRVPSLLNGMNLVAVAAAVGTAGTTGTTDIQIHNVTQAADMLSTKITIDSTETDSKDATAAAVIDTDNDDVATGDILRVDIDAVSTTKPKGLVVELVFGP